MLTKKQTIYILSALFLFFQCASIEDYKWNTVISESSPSARHECGFVEANGLFYLLGGRGIKPVDIYNVKTKKWTKGSEPPIEIHHFQAVSYNDDLYLIGAMTGKYPHEKPLDKILIYKPKEDKWVWGDAIPVARRRGSAGIVVTANFAYVISGITDGHWEGHVPWLDRYNFKTGEWTILSDAPRSRDHFHAAIHNNKIYCASGRNSSAKTYETFNLTIPEVDVYNIENNSWETLPETSNIPTQRAGASAIINKGKLIIIGGESASQKTAHNEIDIMDMAKGNWVSAEKLEIGRHGTQAIFYNNAIYIVAGSGNRGGKPELASLETFTK
ncbi:Kelch repeat-containing protein [Algibacter sp.]|uniref:Kelch repeat-containing protein n=1 Tax=Algibacter sp. TaxID=1872428 RepID=UPI003C788D5D